MNQSILDKLAQCKSLPSIPAIALRVLSLCKQEEVDIAELARVISADPALSAKLLRVVNSSLYGRRQALRTVSQAIVMLGMTSVRTLALSFSLNTSLRRSQPRDFDYTHYWRRSLGAALCARELALVACRALAEEAFLAALLQDIGMIALAHISGPLYPSEEPPQGRPHEAWPEVEREALECDHIEVGGWLAERWTLPLFVARAIRASHGAVTSAGVTDDDDVLCRVVAVSGPIVDIWLTPGGSALEKAQVRARELLGMSPEDLDTILRRLTRALNEVAPLFDVAFGTAEELTAVLDQAREALLALTLKAARAAEEAEATARAIAEHARSLEEESSRDSLTGLYNRRRLEAFIELELKKAWEFGLAFSVLMVDVDHFKDVNDTYGHLAGDDVLRSIVGCVKAGTRKADLLARFGGEEFVAVLPGADGAAARMVGERIRRFVADTPHAVGPGRTKEVTVSVGCATWGEPKRFRSLAEMLEAADLALYKAKSSGRNRVEVVGRELPLE